MVLDDQLLHELVLDQETLSEPSIKVAIYQSHSHLSYLIDSVSHVGVSAD